MLEHMNYHEMMEKTLASLGDKKPRLLLHACCAPCASWPLELLSGRAVHGGRRDHAAVQRAHDACERLFAREICHAPVDSRRFVLNRFQQVDDAFLQRKFGDRAGGSVVRKRKQGGESRQADRSGERKQFHRGSGSIGKRLVRHRKGRTPRRLFYTNIALFSGFSSAFS